MTFKELIAKSETELHKDLKELRAEVAQLTVKVRLAQTKNTNELGQKRRDIARILTALGQK